MILVSTKHGLTSATANMCKYFKKNPKPKPGKRATVTFLRLPSVQTKDDDDSSHYFHNCTGFDEERIPFIVETQMLETILGLVHPFTAVGLQSEAFGYSYGTGECRTTVVSIMHAYVLPRINEEYSVRDDTCSSDPREVF